MKVVTRDVKVKVVTGHKSEGGHQIGESEGGHQIGESEGGHRTPK